MASQWIRWNQTTHIFEYSTDNGASFVPLPLSAATINEGNIPDSILSANVVKEDIANVFTSALPISIESANPIIQFKETDQPADSRFWRESFQGGTYRLQSLTDALGATDLLTVDRTGVLNVSQNADHIFGGSVGANVNRIRIKNTVSGTDRYSGLSLDTDAINLGMLNAFTSGYTSSGPNIASGVTLVSQGVGGVSISAFNASGAVRLYSGGSASPRLTIASGGDAVFSGSITEYGRATPQGVWTSVPFNASDFSAAAGTWTVAAGDLVTFRYTLVGKIMFVALYVRGNVSTTTGELRVKIPGGYTAAAQSRMTCQVNDITAWTTGIMYTTPGATVIGIGKVNVSNWTVATGIYIIGELMFEVN